MSRLRTLLLATALGASLLPSVISRPADAASYAVSPTYKQVLLISVDGLHAVDLTNWTVSHPHGALAGLARHGFVYQNALTTAPSDSFPGMIGLATGASPRTAGLFYDDSFDRLTWPAGSNCQGAPGAEITNFEQLDKSLADYTAGGTLGQPLTQIDPTQLQMQLVGGVCQPVYPHQYIRTNTIFEVIKANGMRTAWSDKHPAYEVLNGPSGAGIDDLYTPEINAQDTIDAKAAAGDDYTKSYTGVRSYDSLKVQAVLNWIDGLDSTGSHVAGVPAVFGMNFQAVSVGQKLAKAGAADGDKTLVGGYLDGNATPGNALTQQLQFVDQSLGRMTRELAKRGIADSTLVIVTAKHGQSPIDPTLRQATKVIDNTLPNTPGYAFHICDDEALIWLDPSVQAADYAAAKAFLKANMAALKFTQLLDRTSLAPIYRDPFKDSRTPDFVGVTQHGVICTGGSKLAEHGGFSSDDRNVALLLSSPKLAAHVVAAPVTTLQVAPTILYALGLDPKALNGVTAEGTKVLANH